MSEFDKNDVAEELVKGLTRVDPDSRFRTLELYHRAAATARVRLDPDDEMQARRGAEQGTALRAEPCDRTEIRFAAGSGAGEELTSRLAELASRGPGGGWSDPWTADAASRIDVDPFLGLPSMKTLEDWLMLARDALRTEAGDDAGRLVCWVEVARTVETWAGSSGLRAGRARTRAWAQARSPNGAARPMTIGSRTFDSLRIDSWSAIWAERAAEAAMSSAHGPLLLTSEASSALALALVRVAHGPGAASDRPVGPGWRLIDDPQRAGALFGGRFDDAGFETHRTVLADGKQVRGAIGEQGFWRRPSFRDRPVAMISNLVIEPPQVDVPQRVRPVAELAVHPLEPGRWLLEVGPAEGRAWIETSPLRLLERCVGGVGPARASHRGVTTPALLFE